VSLDPRDKAAAPEGWRRIEFVQKRDGSQAPFDRAKIESAVRRAQQAAGDEDPQLAREVADLACVALERQWATARGSANPPIEAIQDLVEQALVELGRFPVAKAYILYRDRRARIRAATSEGSARGADVRGPSVQDSRGVEPWRKERIVAALMEEADLPRASAEEVAAQVEAKVLASGLRRLSTTLVRELVDEVLFERGAAAALSRARPVAVPRADIERWLAADVHPRSRIADEVLLRYSLEHLLPPAVAESHLSGEIHVLGLSSPHQSLAHAVPLESFLDGEPGPRALHGALDEISLAARSVAHALVLDEALDPLAALLKDRRGAEASAARGWLSALAAIAASCNRPIELALCGRSAQPGARERARLVALLVELAELAAADEATPRAILELQLAAELVDSDDAARAALERLLERRLVRFSFAEEGARAMGHGLSRREGERGALRCATGVALNLPRAARRAGAWREDLLFAELRHQLELALEAHAGLAQARRQRRLEGARARGRSSAFVAPVGLREACRIACDGEVRVEAATRMCAFLAEACERLGAARGLAVQLDLVPCDDAAARFLESDRRLWPLRQERLFDERRPEEELPGQRAGGEEGVSAGLELQARAEMRRLGGEAVLDSHARLLAGLREGALESRHLLEGCAGGRPAEDAPLARALARLAARRARIRSGVAPLQALRPAARPVSELFPSTASTEETATPPRAAGALDS
jgi:hypothetical protein